MALLISGASALDVAAEKAAVAVHAHDLFAVDEALQKSGNQGQAPSEWELRTEDGRLLDQGLTARSR